jgi:hypothetical protein
MLSQTLNPVQLLPAPDVLHSAGYRDGVAGKSPNREFCTNADYSRGFDHGRREYRRNHRYQVQPSNLPDTQPLTLCMDGADEIFSLMPV